MKQFEIICEKIIMDEYRSNTLEILNIEANDDREALNIVSKDLFSKFESELLKECYLDDGTLLLKSHKKTLPIITFKLKVITK